MQAQTARVEAGVAWPLGARRGRPARPSVPCCSLRRRSATRRGVDRLEAVRPHAAWPARQRLSSGAVTAIVARRAEGELSLGDDDRQVASQRCAAAGRLLRDRRAAPRTPVSIPDIHPDRSVRRRRSAKSLLARAGARSSCSPTRPRRCSTSRPARATVYSNSDNIIAALIARGGEGTAPIAERARASACSRPLRLTAHEPVERCTDAAARASTAYVARSAEGARRHHRTVRRTAGAGASGGIVSTPRDANTFVRAYVRGALTDARDARGAVHVRCRQPLSRPGPGEQLGRSRPSFATARAVARLRRTTCNIAGFTRVHRRDRRRHTLDRRLDQRADHAPSANSTPLRRTARASTRSQSARRWRLSGRGSVTAEAAARALVDLVTSAWRLMSVTCDAGGGVNDRLRARSRTDPCSASRCRRRLRGCTASSVNADRDRFGPSRRSTRPSAACFAPVDAFEQLCPPCVAAARSAAGTAAGEAGQFDQRRGSAWRDAAHLLARRRASRCRPR